MNKKMFFQSLSKKVLFFLLTISLFYKNSLAQNYVKESLSWLNVVSENKNILTFNSLEGKTNNNFGTLSYEYFLGEIPYNQKFTIDIANVISIPLTQEELELINTDKYNNTDFQVSTRNMVERKTASSFLNIKAIRVNPNTNILEKLVSFDIHVNLSINNPVQLTGKLKKTTWANESVLASGNFIKVFIENTGIYKITSSELNDAGLQTSGVDINQLKLYGHGGGMLPESNDDPNIKNDLVENAIKVADQNGNGKFDSDDYILFYGVGPHVWNFDAVKKQYSHSYNIYSEENAYFISVDKGNNGRRVQPKSNPGITPTYNTNAYDHLYFYEKDIRNLTSSGRNWMGEEFYHELSYDFSIPVPDRIVGENIFFRTMILGRSTTATNMVVKANNQQLLIKNIKGISFGYPQDYTDDPKEEYVSETIQGSQDINLNFSYNRLGNNDAKSWLDYFEVISRANMVFHSDALKISDVKSLNQASNFSIQTNGKTLQIWNVSDVNNPKDQQYASNGNQINFNQEAVSDIQKYIVFDAGNYMSVKRTEKVENQNLHALSNIDMVIVSYPDFLKQANYLAEYRKNRDNFECAVVTPAQVYNEFSSGIQDISAIRNLMKILYDKAGSPSEMPKYLLLFGDASFDYKNRVANNTNFVPCFESVNSINPVASYASDDYFAFLDDNEGGDWDNRDYSMDIGVGRIPCRTAEQAQTIIDKILIYENPDNKGDWRNKVCLFSDDDNPYETFMRDSEKAAGIVESDNENVIVKKVYLDAYKQEQVGNGQRCPEAREDLIQQFSKGNLIITFVGHGGPLQLTHEQVVDFNFVNSIKNLKNMPLFMTATCDFAKYDDPALNPAGKQAYFNPNGGVISMITTARLIYISTAGSITQEMMKAAFNKLPNGEVPRTGDIERIMKNNEGSYDKKSVVLFGDPSMQLAYPENNVVTDEINHTPVSDSDTVTFGALGKISIKGHLEDIQNNLMSDFNGELVLTLYDKKTTLKTFGDEGGAPQDFSMYENILFKGKYSVKNGVFEAEFIIPKDIAYVQGLGKISYYAFNKETDANGSFGNVKISGTDPNAVIENKGPQIKLYMNDTTFRFGGYTDQSPNLLAYVFDESGINTTNSGVGREINAVLDGNEEKSIILNDYYEASLDNYKAGKILYPFTELADGRHTLKLKIWDINNNSAEATTEFIVAKNSKFVIENIMNYPNPFSDKTTFSFQHNQEDNIIEITVEIYDVQGKLLTVLKKDNLAPNADFNQLQWDGADNNGALMPNGIYFYKVKVKNQNGMEAIKGERLVIIRP